MVFIFSIGFDSQQRWYNGVAVDFHFLIFSVCDENSLLGGGDDNGETTMGRLFVPSREGMHI